MKTAVIYARYSSDNQTEQSIEGQLRVCQDYAQRNNIVVLNTYIDRAMTGTNVNRPDFQQMIKDSSKKEFDNIIVYKIDRFSRNKYETAKYKKILKDNGVKLLSAMENIPDTPEGIILESLLEGMAEYYSAELSQKVKCGMNETRLKGNFTGGTIIYGYNVENHKVVINEEQAEVVRYIYKQYSLGTYVKDIIKSLTERGILNKGKPFARNTIYNILKNEKYAGIYRHGNEIFENMYPRIVSTDIYDIVRNKTSNNTYGKRSTEVNYLLRHKLTCGYCGMPISAECGTTGSGKKYRYYKCLGRKRNNGCEKSNIPKELLENFILKNITKILQKPQIMNTVINNLLKVQKEKSNGTALLNTLLKEKKQSELSLDNLVKAIEQGIFTATTNKRIKELESTIEQLGKQILIEQNKTRMELSRGDIEKFYKEALLYDSFNLINYVIKNIKVYEDKIEITFNSPIQISSDDNQGFFLYSYITNLPQYIQDIEVKLYI